MASVAEGRTGAGIYWINDTSDEEQSVVFIPGLSKKMGVKSVSVSSNEGKVKGRAGRDSEKKGGKKAGLPMSRLAVETPASKAPLHKTSDFSAKSKMPIQFSGPPVAQAVSPNSEAKSKASLKDLCPEDKRRIANLIEELARVSEEKEESVQRLRDEQETFEKKIQQLEQQNQLIVQERESLQQQYRECQELLGLYQQYLSQQQEKLNKSIAQLNQSRSHREMASSEKALSRPQGGGGKGTALDGSYLDLSSYGSKGGKGGSVDCAHSPLKGFCDLASVPSSCCERDSSGHYGCTIGARKCPEGAWSEPGPDRRSKGEHLVNTAVGPHGATEPRGSCHGLGPECRNRASVELSKTVAPLGREDWVEKRQRLLLQKKQLELERERLQARLAQQEERLLKQNQELRQSRLDYSKFQQATTAELEQSFNGARLNEDPKPSVTVDTHSVRKEGGLQALQGSVRQPLNDAQPQKCNGNIQPPEPGHLLDKLSTVAKKDMATSPVHSQSVQKSNSPLAMPLRIPKTPGASRLDSSLIELMDIFSPIANPGRSRVSPVVHRNFAGPLQPLSAIRPPHRSLLSPSGQAQPSQQDLEESQILEDIFFIC